MLIRVYREKIFRVIESFPLEILPLLLVVATVALIALSVIHRVIHSADVLR